MMNRPESKGPESTILTSGLNSAVYVILGRYAFSETQHGMGN